MTTLPPWIVVDQLLQNWLLEDVGRGDMTTAGLFSQEMKGGKAEWIVKATGIIAGLPMGGRVFQLLNPKIDFLAMAAEGEKVSSGQVVARLDGSVDGLLMGERVALNLVMRLSGIATMTGKYGAAIADLPVQLVDTRKTTPGMRILEKYATRVGGAINHRMGLDDAVMIKDNHIQAVGGIGAAISRLRDTIPYPLSIEVETGTIAQVREALEWGADIIMLDNMGLEEMGDGVKLIRGTKEGVKIEASGNITLENIRSVAETGVDYISTSAPITRSTWLDLSMNFLSLDWKGIFQPQIRCKFKTKPGNTSSPDKSAGLDNTVTANPGR